MMENTISKSMKKSLYSLVLIFVGLSATLAQSRKSLFVEVGGAYSTFQDVKYSAVSYSGGGAAFTFGFEKENTKSIWSAGLDITFGKEKPNTHSSGNVTALNPKFFGRYLRKINDQLSIGGHWDILGMYFRNTEGLDNNGSYYITSSDLFASGTYQFGKFNFGLDLGVLSYQKERTSFAFSAPQNALEDGNFDYQDEALDNPFGFKYFRLKSLPQQLNIRTNITYQWKDRISVAYQWSARHFAEVKNYPVTIGSHQIVLRYNISYKTKSGATSSLNN